MSVDGSFDETTVLPRALEILAGQHPETPWMTVPTGSDVSSGWQNITYGDFGQAVDGFAQWAQDTTSASESEVVAYMG